MRLNGRPLFALTATLAVVGSLHAAPADAQTARDFVSIAGSSTVFPFSAAVAENFGRTHRQFKTPRVEATGTGGGIKQFCSGVGPQTVDIANASRRIKQSELDDCRKNGVREVVEVKIGFDGIVLANARAQPTYQLTRREIFLALAKTVPDPKNANAFVANPHRTWNQINPKLPNVRIEVLGPPPTSGTRDAFVELVMDAGCDTFPSLKALREKDPTRHRQLCQTIREDGTFIEAGENDNLIVQKLIANPRALGLFGYSFLEENLNTIHGSIIEGSEPTFENIATGRYPVSRSMYVYVKRAHLASIPGLREFVVEFVSERAMGEDGYLPDKGLIPLPAPDLAKVRQVVRNMTPMAL